MNYKTLETLMITKKRKEQLENLLDWEREGDRLPKTKELFNREVSPSLFLREAKEKLWVIETLQTEKENRTIKNRTSVLISHETLIQLGLSILDAVKQAEDRLIK